MKRFLLRIGALGAVLVLGWIAIAHAQRDGDDAASLSKSPADALGEPLPLDVDPWASPLPSSDLPTAPTPALPAATRLVSHDDPAPPRVTPLAEPPEPSMPAPPADPFGLAAPLGPIHSPTEPIAARDADEPAAGPEPPRLLAAGDGLATDQEMPRRAPAPLDETPRERHPLESVAAPEVSERPLAPSEPQPALAPLGPSLDSPADEPAFPPRPLGQQPRAESGDLATSVEGTGRPSGDKQFEGVQSPQLNIQKFAPAEIQVGKPADFRVTVKNFGQTPALGVEVRDQIPQGTRLIDAVPPASRGARGELVWQLGKLDPGKETTVEMRVMPTVEGEIGSVATVFFQADASARSFSTRPQLVVDVSAPRQVMIDESATLTITVSNPGTGVATGVVIEERVPPGLQHEAGAELEYEVGTLAPNESRTLELKLTAVRPGPGANVLAARAEGVPQVTKELPIDVIAPELKIALDGPASRFLKREAIYRVAVSNPGSAPAREVLLEATLPSGLQFVRANNNGQFDPKTRKVQWALAELPVNETGTVELTAMPVEIGRQTLSFRGSAQKAVEVTQQQDTVVDGIAAIRFEVVDVQDPIEVGSETTYEIRVLNQGSKEATAVQVTVELPPGLQPVAAEGPDAIEHALDGNRIVFAPLPRLSPKVDTTYRIRVQGRQAGDQRIRVLLQTSQMQTPVTKEESTRVFSDR
ncbi:MAG: DUF11 domain-containing protein [Pirellulales bacterium]|nr:DUF11 domain-containing protein [Pirellulales bacterium]